jgi:hypothetical protein
VISFSLAFVPRRGNICGSDGVRVGFHWPHAEWGLNRYWRDGLQVAFGEDI